MSPQPLSALNASGLWRLATWGGAAVLLLLPLVAMRFTREVQWTGSDFAIFGAMLACACTAFELTLRVKSGLTYRLGAALALLTAFFLVWVNLAVGVIGSEDNPANWLYVGVLAIGLGGAVASRLQPAGLSRVLALMALATVLAPLLARAAQPQSWVLSAGVAALWLGAAWLFGRAARQAETDAD